jgi:Protein of unknown function (DUF3054)
VHTHVAHCSFDKHFICMFARSHHITNTCASMFALLHTHIRMCAYIPYTNMLVLCKIRWGLAVGDVIALTAFAWIGRGSHGSSALDFEVIKTALPFYAGLFVIIHLRQATSSAYVLISCKARVLVFNRCN